MPVDQPLTCEVKVEGLWRAVSLNEAAVSYSSALKRCPACHGRVMILGTYSRPDVRRSMSHRKSHGGCPLKPDTYTGTPSLHPQALT